MLLSRNGNRILPLFRVFVAVWGILAVTNMWIGVTQAGYTFLEELPIFLLIFLGPVIPGYFIQKQLQKRRANPSGHPGKS